MSNVRTECLVVGSGPGGATTSRLLAEAGKEVVLMEEGRDLPLDSCAPFSLAEMRDKYRAGGLNPALGRSKIAFVEARTVGGGSEINSGLYHRTPGAILEQWQRDFDTRNTLERDLCPHFFSNEQDLTVSTTPGQTPPASRRLAVGAERLGWHAMEVPRWFQFSGTTGRDGCPLGVRQSMTRTFVPRAREAGACLLPETRAVRIGRAGSGWEVQTLRRCKADRVIAESVFLCCGALQTPLLLQRSGLAGKTGDTLAMHPTVKVVAEFDEEVNHEEPGVGVHQVKEFAPRMSFGCSISSKPYLALALAGRSDGARLLKHRWRHMAVYYAMITGPNTGTIRPVWNAADPLVRYRLESRDYRDLATGLRRLATLLLAAGARALYPCIDNAPAIRGEDELSTIPATLSPAGANLMTIHLFSSCPMGENRSRCAADSMGQVHGASNLFIHDASLIPSAPGVNPQGTIMALARRNTMHFLGRL